MTYNELVGKIAQRAEELADLTMKELRLWHPDVVGIGTDYEAKGATAGMSKGRIIADILTEEFCIGLDVEVGH